MGKYPVISISLKGADAANYDEAYRLMVQIINDEAECFQFLLDSEKLTKIDKMRYETLIDMEMQPAVLAMSLKKLTTLLEKHYGQKVVVLIDEYDVPLAKAYENNLQHPMGNIHLHFQNDNHHTTLLLPQNDCLTHNMRAFPVLPHW